MIQLDAHPIAKSTEVAAKGSELDALDVPRLKLRHGGWGYAIARATSVWAMPMTSRTCLIAASAATDSATRSSMRARSVLSSRWSNEWPSRTSIFDVFGISAPFSVAGLNP